MHTCKHVRHVPVTLHVVRPRNHDQNRQDVRHVPVTLHVVTPTNRDQNRQVRQQRQVARSGESPGNVIGNTAVGGDGSV